MLYTLPAVLGKFVLGSFVPHADGGCCNGGFFGNYDDALIVGIAMVARGELGFVMAQQSRRDEMMDDVTYASCVWALFLCTLLPPACFGWALNRKRKKETAAAAAAAPTAAAGGGLAIKAVGSTAAPAGFVGSLKAVTSAV